MRFEEDFTLIARLKYDDTLTDLGVAHCMSVIRSLVHQAANWLIDHGGTLQC
jgi:hypothetical protein